MHIVRYDLWHIVADFICKPIPANSHALGVSLTPAGWKLPSHAGSGLRANFSRLIQKCELLPSWLTQLLKICSSNPCKERKPCVKWINDNSFLVISDFWSEKHLTRARVYTRPKTSDVFGRLRTSSEDFILLRESSEMIVSSSEIPRTPRRKVSRLYSHKKLAGIQTSFAVWWKRWLRLNDKVKK